MEQRDPVQAFLLHSHELCKEARFIIDSFPNAETVTVERLTHQLYAVRSILHSCNDPHLNDEDIECLLDFLDTHLVQLDAFLDQPPLPISSHLPRTYTGNPGRPSYQLDVERLCLLHDLGNSWIAIGRAYGVDRKTIYNHLLKAGISPERKAYTVITDEALDEVVSEISLQHPFIGSTILMGHLETRQIHLPRKRVQDSLRRVDVMGVLTRCVS